MDIEWDEAKRAANLAKHGLDLADAAEVFAEPFLERLDTRREYGEDRWAVLGQLRGRVVFLVYTERDEKMRPISLRKATAEERRIYEQAVANRP